MRKSRTFLLIALSWAIFIACLALAQEKHWSKYKYPTELPPDAKVHHIVKGDTLWDLAAHYLGNPFLWPKIWEANKYITDPDLIFPQDPLIIPEVKVVPEEALAEEEPKEEAAEEEVAEPKEEAAEAEVEAISPAPLIPLAVEFDLYCSPFIKKNMDGLDTKIIGAEESGAMGLTVYDVVYINRGSAQGIKPGEQLSVVRKEETVHHPSSGKNLGYVFSQVGVVKILVAQPDSSIAQITSACDDVSIGDFLLPYKEIPIPMVEAIPELEESISPEREIIGSIIYAKDKQVGIGQYSIVLIDLGTEQKVKPGDFFRIFYVDESEGRKISRVAGQLVVIKTEDNFSICRLTKSLKDILLGYQVELQ